MSRAAFLFARVSSLSRALGDGPWLWAVTGRLMAASGLEPPVRPWYAGAADVNAAMIGYQRELGNAGFYNRRMRKVPRYARRVLEGNHGQ